MSSTSIATATCQNIYIFSAALQASTQGFYTSQPKEMNLAPLSLAPRGNLMDTCWNGLAGHGAGCKWDPRNRILVPTRQIFSLSCEDSPLVHQLRNSTSKQNGCRSVRGKH